ncbi:MAG: sigma-70 family RNA polymerase sigma factor, partial [Actinobacteria bacterium]|nr:sigma-70 family RNA polymerase sigma factor [Actinomycetota bacterium]
MYERHCSAAFSLAYRMCGARAAAEDVVQEAFAAALGASYRGEAQVRTWLVGILVRQAARLRRGRARWRRGTHDAERDPPPEPRPVVQPRSAAETPRPAAVVPTAPAAVVPSGAVPAEPAAKPRPLPAEPIELVADVIKVIAERPPEGEAATASVNDRGGQVREVHTTGGVIVRQKRGPDEEPLIIRG